jgi:hypothetical protein
MLAVIELESAEEAGGLDPATACVVTALPTGVPPDGQAPPVVWFGLHTKNVTEPVGVPPPDAWAVTRAWSVTDDPKVVVPPEPTDGVVMVPVWIVWTVKHSLVPFAPPNSASGAV